MLVRKWQTEATYVQRTDAIIKTLASMYKDSLVVTVIAPLNECVFLWASCVPIF